MRSLLIPAVLVMSSCAVPAQIALRGDGVEQPPVVETDGRAPATWYMHEPDVTGDCKGMYDGPAIPCRDVINVCIENSVGEWSTLWMPDVFRCTDESPTLADVCAAVPDDLLGFYGMTREDCPT